MSALNNNKMHSEEKKNWKHPKSKKIMDQKECGFLQGKLCQEDQITFLENKFIVLVRKGKVDVIYQRFIGYLVQKLQVIFNLFRELVLVGIDYVPKAACRKTKKRKSQGVGV